METVENQFVGNYVADIRDALIASVLSSSHAAVISPPGWGKSVIADQMGRRIAGDDHFNLIPLDPSSLPSAIKGEEKLDGGNIVTDVTGTPYDPEMKIVTADEAFRANDPVFDAMLHATDPLKQDRCTVWVTSNFVPQHERIQALISRFAIWLQVTPEPFDAGEMAVSQLMAGGMPTVPGQFPTWQTVEDVRAAAPGPKIAESIRDYISLLGSEAEEAGLNLTPRQIGHWQRVLFRMNVYETGKADTMLSADAQKALRFVWPSVDRDAWNLWQSVVGSLVDPVGAAIDAILANVAPQFVEVAEIDDQSERTNKLPDLGRALADAQSELYDHGGDDERANEAVKKLNDWFRMAAQGKKPKLGKLES